MDAPRIVFSFQTRLPIPPQFDTPHIITIHVLDMPTYLTYIYVPLNMTPIVELEYDNGLLCDFFPSS